MSQLSAGVTAQCVQGRARDTSGRDRDVAAPEIFAEMRGENH